jgi:S1-C subfamily serine protease
MRFSLHLQLFRVEARKYSLRTSKEILAVLTMSILLSGINPYPIVGQTKTTPSRAGVTTNTSIPSKPLTLPQAISQIRQSVVQISVVIDQFPPNPQSFAGRPQTRVLGSGFLVSDDYFITAKHVIDAFQSLPVPDGNGRKRIGVGVAGLNTSNVRGTFGVYEVEIVDQDSVHDLVLLHKLSYKFMFQTLAVAIITPSKGGPQQIPEYQPLKPARLSVDRPEEGDAIATSGYPLNNAVLITTSGTVASSWDFYESEFHPPGAPPSFIAFNIEDRYLADLRVNHGNSGGPVYSISSGAVIGVCQAFELADVEAMNVPSVHVPLVYNSGISLFVPARYIAELLKKNNVKWSQ